MPALLKELNQFNAFYSTAQLHFLHNLMAEMMDDVTPTTGDVHVLIIGAGKNIHYTV
jgi:hypothetical protein